MFYNYIDETKSNYRYLLEVVCGFSDGTPPLALTQTCNRFRSCTHGQLFEISVGIFGVILPSYKGKNWVTTFTAQGEVTSAPFGQADQIINIF